MRVDRAGGDITVDLSSRDGLSALYDQTSALIGGAVDSVIACAGLTIPDPLTLAVNYFGMIGTFEILRPLLARGQSPRAVGVSSFGALGEMDPEISRACLDGDQPSALAACVNKPWGVIYSTSKALFTLWVRRTAILPEWAGAGILLNATAPGITNTPMNETIERMGVKAMREKIDFSIPLGRNAAPMEQAELLLWMASAQNSYIVGQTIFADGGAEAKARPEHR